MLSEVFTIALLIVSTVLTTFQSHPYVSVAFNTVFSLPALSPFKAPTPDNFDYDLFDRTMIVSLYSKAHYRAERLKAQLERERVAIIAHSYDVSVELMKHPSTWMHLRVCRCSHILWYRSSSRFPCLNHRILVACRVRSSAL